jgi:hypothetical protein
MVTIRALEIPGNPFATPQALRASALKWQLMALAAQAKAIKAIAQEHQINLSDLAPETFVGRAEDLVRTGTRLSMAAETTETEKLLKEIINLRTVAEQLQEDVMAFVKVADQRAHFRLSSLLPVLFDNVEPQCSEPSPEHSETEAAAADADRLAVDAGNRCYHAESEQHGTFALQVRSICDLTLEMALSSASEFAAKK